MRSHYERRRALRRYEFLIDLLQDLRDEYMTLITSKDTDFYLLADRLTDLEIQLANTKTEVLSLHIKLNGYTQQEKTYEPRVEFYWSKKGKMGVVRKHGHPHTYTKAVKAHSV